MEYVTPGGSLCNQDFKKLMMTPRRGAAADTPVPDYLTRKRRRREGQRIDTAEVFAKPQKARGEDTPTPGYGARRVRESRYRDRAIERKKGDNPDYADDSKMLREAGLPERKKDPLDTPLYTTPSRGAPPGGATPQDTPAYTPAPALAFATPAPGQSTSVGGTTVTRLSSATPHSTTTPAPGPSTGGGGPAVPTEAVAEVRNKEIREQIEKSKYLGGDVRHTHLVRGLDFALLQKVRQEIGHQSREEAEGRRDTPDGAADAVPGPPAPSPFRTPIGERLHAALLQPKPRKVDTFRTGRTFYVIDFEEDAGDVPITQFRPRHELDLSADEYHHAGLPAGLLAQLNAVCLDRRRGGAGTMKERKRRERERERERQEEEERRQVTAARPADVPAPPRVPVPDEDIFPEVGEYVPAEVPSSTRPSSLPRRTHGPLFADLREARHREEQEAEALRTQLKKHAQAYAKAEDPAARPPGVPPEADADPFQLDALEVPHPRALRPPVPRTAAPGHLGPAPAGDYDECYPATGVDDDDGVYGDMDLKVGKRKRHGNGPKADEPPGKPKRGEDSRAGRPTR